MNSLDPGEHGQSRERRHTQSRRPRRPQRYPSTACRPNHQALRKVQDKQPSRQSCQLAQSYGQALYNTAAMSGHHLARQQANQDANDKDKGGRDDYQLGDHHHDPGPFPNRALVTLLRKHVHTFMRAGFSITQLASRPQTGNRIIP